MAFQDRFHFRAVITAEYFTKNRKKAETAFVDVVIDDVVLYPNGEVGFSQDALDIAVSKLALTAKEQESVLDWFEIMCPESGDCDYRYECKELMQSIGMRDSDGILIFERDYLQPWGAYSTVVIRGSYGVNGWQIYATTSKDDPLKPIKEFPSPEQVEKFRVIGNEYIGVTKKK